MFTHLRAWAFPRVWRCGVWRYLRNIGEVISPRFFIVIIQPSKDFHIYHSLTCERLKKHEKTITLALLSAMLLPYSANAQGVKFGKRYMKQRVEQRRQNAAKEAVAKAAKETAVLKASSDNILDEYEEKDGDRITPMTRTICARQREST